MGGLPGGAVPAGAVRLHDLHQRGGRGVGDRRPGVVPGDLCEGAHEERPWMLCHRRLQRPAPPQGYRMPRLNIGKSTAALTWCAALPAKPR